MKIKEHNEYNIIKVFAILLVVLGHITIMYRTNSSFPQQTGNIHMELITFIIYLFHMPLFIYVSGAVYCIGKANGKYSDTTKFIYQKMRRIMIPYLFVDIIFLIPTFYFLNMTYNSFIQCIIDFLIGVNVRHLWFLLALFEIFLFIRVANKLKPYYLLIFSFLFALIYSQYIKLEYLCLHMAVRYLPYFLLGYVIEYYNLYPFFEKRRWLFILTGLFISVLIYLNEIEILDSFLSMILPCFIIIPLILFAKVLNKGGYDFNKCFLYRRLSIDNFGIYLFHPMIIYACFYLLHNLTIYPVISLPVIFMLSISICIIICWIIRKIKLNFIIGEYK